MKMAGWTGLGRHLEVCEGLIALLLGLVAVDASRRLALPGETARQLVAALLRLCGGGGGREGGGGR